MAFGILVASALGSDVTLLTVRPPHSGPEAGSRVRNAAQDHLAVPHVNHVLRRGIAETEIIAEVSTGNYDLLVIGARDHRGSAGELLLGDLAYRVVKQTPISALVVRGKVLEMQNILVCTAGHDAATATVTTGAKLAQATDARVTLLHVAAAVPSMYTGLAQIGETLPDLLQTETPTARHLRNCAELMRSHQVEAILELRHGMPAKEILRSIERGSFDLLIVGASARQGLGRMLLDEVSQKLVAHSALPVLVARTGLDAVIT